MGKCGVDESCGNTVSTYLGVLGNSYFEYDSCADTRNLWNRGF